MKIDLKKIAINIVEGDNGIFQSKEESKIFYPDEGNDSCMQVEERSFWFKHRNDIIAASVKLYGKGKTFFDIGGGNGFVSKRIQDDGSEVVLVEPGGQGAVNAMRRGVNNVICSTLEDAGFKKNSIDSVGLFDVVEHIEDDMSFMKTVNLYLKEEGIVYITVPAYRFLWSKEDDDAKHFKRYTLNKISKLLTDSGFKVKYSTYFFSILPFPIFLFRTLPSKLGLNKKSNEISKHKEEHAERKGLLSGVIQKLWDWELKRVENQQRILFGGSCFIVAIKEK